MFITPHWRCTILQTIWRTFPLIHITVAPRGCQVEIRTQHLACDRHSNQHLGYASPQVGQNLLRTESNEIFFWRLCCEDKTFRCTMNRFLNFSRVWRNSEVSCTFLALESQVRFSAWQPLGDSLLITGRSFSL
jgi:hypothetical protein